MVLRRTSSRLSGSLFATLFVCGCIGCSPKAPVVSSPIEPWEEEIVKEKITQRDEENRRYATQRALQRQDGFGQEKPPDEHSIIVTTLADIIAFPLRGAAWLAHTIL